MPPTLVTKTRQNIQYSPLLGRTTTTDFSADGSFTESFSPDPRPQVVLNAYYEALTSMGHRGPPFNEGGPFFLQRYRFKTVMGDLSVPKHYYYPLQPDTANTAWETSGGIAIDPYLMGLYSPISPPTDYDQLKAKYDSFIPPAADLNTYGAQAIDRFSPLKPGANMGQFFGELHDLPQIPLRLFKRLGFFKALGGEYLNAQFGWAPFVQDLRAFYQTWQTLDSRMKQIVKDNGRPVRRKGTLKKASSVVPSSVVTGGLPPYPQPTSGSLDNAGFSGARVEIKKEMSQDIWFAGEFRYYLPFLDSVHWPIKAKLALFGINPNPDLLYQLMPWSWLIDWFTNLGSVISNSVNNGIADLIIDYGYCMRHTKNMTTATFPVCTGINYINGFKPAKTTSGLAYFTASELFETKERVAASPFGFGLQIDELSARQLAILAALGLSRQNFL